MSSRMRSVLLVTALSVSAVEGCGGRATDAFDPGPPSNPEAIGRGGSLLRAATRGDDAYVLSIDANTGAAIPFGPRLPIDVSAGWVSLYVTQASTGLVAVSATASSIISQKGIQYLAPSSVFVGDGAAWREITRRDGLVSAAVSDDGSHVLVESGCAELENVHQAVFDTSGTKLWSGGCNGEPRIVGVAQDGAHAALLHDGAIWASDRAGREVRLTDAVDASTPVQAIFPTSIVVRSPSGARWFDFEGRALDVAGFASSARLPRPDTLVVADVRARLQFIPHSIASNLVMLDGVLTALEDRRVVPIMPLPAEVDPGDVVAFERSRFVLAREAAADGSTSLHMIGASGANRAQFENAGSFPCMTPDALATRGAWPWAVVTTGTFHPSGIADDIGDTSSRTELWLLGDPNAGGKPRVATVLAESTNDFFEFIPSSDGNFVFIQHEGQLRRVAIADVSSIDAATGWLVY